MKQTKTIGGPADERVAFEQTMVTNIAKLLDFAKPYVGRLNSSDRGALLGSALEKMWEWRKSYKPRSGESLLQYWDRCLAAAAKMRKTWQVSRFDGWTTVRGEHLGAQGA